MDVSEKLGLEIDSRGRKPAKLMFFLPTAMEKSPAFTMDFSLTLRQWPYLYEYIKHGEVEIDNNWCENQIRPFALGRKNWLFAGNVKGAKVAALLYSLIQSYKLNNINARQYLNYVLKQVHKLRRGEVNADFLLPQFIDKNLLS